MRHGIGKPQIYVIKNRKNSRDPSSRFHLGQDYLNLPIDGGFWTPETVFQTSRFLKKKTATKRLFNCLCGLKSSQWSRVILQLTLSFLKLPQISCRLPQWGVFRHRMRHVIEKRKFIFSITPNTQGSQAPDSTSTLNRVIACEKERVPDWQPAWSGQQLRYYGYYHNSGNSHDIHSFLFFQQTTSWKPILTATVNTS